MLLTLMLATVVADSTVHASIEVAPNETLAVSSTGTGDPVVLIPGLFGSAFGFRHVVDSIVSNGRRAITIEPLGIGRSARPKDADYSLTAQAARVGAVLDSLGVSQAVLAAHSVNAAVAYRLAILRPALVAGIVAIEGGVPESTTTDGFRRAMKFAWLLKLIGGPDMVRAQVLKNLRAASVDTSWITEDAIDAYTYGATADVGATIDVYKAMAESSEPWTLAGRLGELECPVRVIVGTTPHRSAPPKIELDMLTTALARVAIDSVSGTGHFVFEERPEAVYESLVKLDAMRSSGRAMTNAPDGVRHRD